MFYAVLGIALLFCLLGAARFLYGKRARVSPRKTPLSVLVVAGSGGHTTEILRLLGSLSESYSPRHYVLADSDKMSEDKIRSFEQKKSRDLSQFFVHPQSHSQKSGGPSVMELFSANNHPFHHLFSSFDLQTQARYGAVQWSRNMRPHLPICNCPGAARTKESDHCVCREHLPCGKLISVWKDSLPLFRLFLCSMAYSERKILQGSLSWANSMTTNVTG